MASQWWVQIEETTSGPFSPDRLRELVAEGTIKPSSLLSRDGQEWAPAAEVTGLVFPAEELAGPADAAPLDVVPLDVVLLDEGTPVAPAVVAPPAEPPLELILLDEAPARRPPDDASPRAGGAEAAPPLLEICPGCREAVVAVAGRCGFCGTMVGADLGATSPAWTAAPPARPVRRRRPISGAVWFAAAGVAGGVLLAVVAVLLFSGKETSDQGPSSRTPTRSDPTSSPLPPSGTSAVPVRSPDDDRDRDKVRLAIVTTRGAEQSSAEAALWEEASKVDGIELCRRDEIAEAIAGRGYQALQMSDAGMAISVGRVLAADLMALVEPPRTPSDTTRVTLLEIRTGRRLAEREGLDMSATSQRCLAADLRRAVAKARSALGRRRYVASVHFRAAEPGGGLDVEARILTALVEQDLAALPDVVVLPRPFSSPPNSAMALARVDRDLRPAAVVVEGVMRRADVGDLVIVSLSVIGAAEEGPSSAEAVVNGDDIVVDYGAVTARLASMLASRPLDARLSPPVYEVALRSERAARLAARGMRMEAGGLYEAAFALQPQGDYYEKGLACYRAYAGNRAYSPCARLQACLHGNCFSLRYFCWVAAHNNPGLPTAWDASLLYSLPSYLGNRDDSAEAARSRDPGGSRARKPRSVRDLQPGNNSAEILSLARRIRFLQEETWKKAVLDRRRRGSGIDDLLLLRLRHGAWAATPDEARRELAATLDEIQMITAGGRALEPVRTLDGAPAEPLERDEALRAAVAEMVDVRWRAEDVLPVLEMLCARRDPAVQVVGLYGKTRLEGQAGVEAAEKFREAIARQPCPVAEAAVRRMIEDCQRLPSAAFRAPPAPPKIVTAPPRPVPPRRGMIDLREEEKRLRPWERYEVRALPLDGANAERAAVVAVVPDAGAPSAAFLLWDLSDDGDRPRGANDSDALRAYRLTRLNVADGTMAEVARFSMKALPPRAEMAVTPEAAYFNPPGGPLAMVRGGKTSYIGAADGLSMEGVDSLTWFEGRLYLGGPEALARFDPATGRCEALAGSRAASLCRDFDAVHGWRVKSILADAGRHCLWVSIDRDARQPSDDQAKCGIWKLAPAENAMHQAWAGAPGYLAWNDGQILFLGLQGRSARFLLFNPQSEQAVQLPNKFSTLATRLQRMPAWALVDGDIFFPTWRLLAADGLESRLDAYAPRWQHVLRLGRGVLVGSAEEMRLWYIEPRPEPAGAGTKARRLSAPIPNLRTWRGSSGESYEAGLVRTQGDAAILRKPNGGFVVRPIDAFSAEDREHIAKMRESRTRAP